MEDSSYRITKLYNSYYYEIKYVRVNVSPVVELAEVSPKPVSS